MCAAPLSQSESAAFDQDGYIIVRQLFDPTEMAYLRRVAKADENLQAKAWNLTDSAGHAAKITLWNKATNDVYGLIARSPRLVDRMERLLGGTIYHYHSKMTMKQPNSPGAWEWHQDYGYWYQNGFLFPHMASCFIAVDKNTIENGCLEVLKGSNRMGRVEHGRYGDQVCADPERIAQAERVCERVACVLEPGDAVFFHSNTLHGSGQNKSRDPRWSLICCYTLASNLPYKEKNLSCEPIERVSDDALREMAAQQ